MRLICQVYYCPANVMISKIWGEGEGGTPIFITRPNPPTPPQARRHQDQFGGARLPIKSEKSDRSPR
jgi:hypothetical protein